MDSYQILMAVYRIQGASDPNHNDSDIKERMREIFDDACEVMRKTGFNPDPED
jgi:hypothetical protein